MARSVADFDLGPDRCEAGPLLANFGWDARVPEAKDQLGLCMKRNMDLVREILLRVEATEPGKTIAIAVGPGKGAS